MPKKDAKKDAGKSVKSTKKPAAEKPEKKADPMEVPENKTAEETPETPVTDEAPEVEVSKPAEETPDNIPFPEKEEVEESEEDLQIRQEDAAEEERREKAKEDYKDKLKASLEEIKASFGDSPWKLISANPLQEQETMGINLRSGVLVGLYMNGSLAMDFIPGAELKPSGKEGVFTLS